MKESKPFIIDLAIGVVLIVIGLVVQIDYYSSMIFAAGCGMAFASVVHLGRLVYWQNPKREAEYAARKQEAHINLVDERKQYLRMKAGYITYQIMTFAAGIGVYSGAAAGGAVGHRHDITAVRRPMAAGRSGVPKFAKENVKPAARRS